MSKVEDSPGLRDPLILLKPIVGDCTASGTSTSTVLSSLTISNSILTISPFGTFQSTRTLRPVTSTLWFGAILSYVTTPCRISAYGLSVSMDIVIFVAASLPTLETVRFKWLSHP